MPKFPLIFLVLFSVLRKHVVTWLKFELVWLVSFFVISEHKPS